MPERSPAKMTSSFESGLQHKLLSSMVAKSWASLKNARARRLLVPPVARKAYWSRRLKDSCSDGYSCHEAGQEAREAEAGDDGGRMRFH